MRRLGHPGLRLFLRRRPQIAFCTVLHSKLPQMMVQMLVHQFGPLAGCERPEKAVRMLGASRGSARGEALQQLKRPLPFGRKVPVIRDHKVL